MSDDLRAAAPASRVMPTGVAAAVAAAVGSLVYAIHLYLFHRLQGESADFLEELAEAAVHLGAWAALVPVVLRLGRRWPLLDRRWPAHVVAQLASALAVACIQLVAHTLLDQALIHGWRGVGAALDAGRGFFARTFFANVVVYAALVLGDGALAWARRRRAREAELERHLAAAQLEVLRQQLQPHFLFNALNAISTLVSEDPSAARRMIARLADLLRHALDERNAAGVPLRHELHLAESYLAIERVRFGDRLTVVRDVPAAALDALVPGLLLQPLLENAVRHGIARRPGAGRIEVSARVQDASLRLRVADRCAAGDGVPAPAHVEERIGLGNVRARLRHLYGDAHRLELASTGDGMAVEVHLPLRFADGGERTPGLVAGQAR